MHLKVGPELQNYITSSDWELSLVMIIVLNKSIKSNVAFGSAIILPQAGQGD